MKTNKCKIIFLMPKKCINEYANKNRWKRNVKQFKDWNNKTLERLLKNNIYNVKNKYQALKKYKEMLIQRFLLGDAVVKNR